MENVSNFAGNLERAVDIFTFKTKFGVSLQVGNVRFISRVEIVQRQDFPPLGQQPIAKVRSEESSSSGDDGSHASSRFDTDRQFSLRRRRIATAHEDRRRLRGIPAV
jgi:hypothetical protein